MPRAPATISTSSSNFKTTGVTTFSTVEQAGEFADGIRKNLEQIKLPEGFQIELYAVVPDARHMAVGPQGIVTFVGTRKTEVWAVTDRNKDRKADEVKTLRALARQGDPERPLLLARRLALHRRAEPRAGLPAAEFFYESPDVASAIVVPQGELIPPEDESFNHTARVCRVGPDNKLYISLGQPFNVPPPEQDGPLQQWGIGGIIRDGPRRQGPRGLRAAASATRSASTSIRRPASSGSPTTRSTAWATTSRRASSTA